MSSRFHPALYMRDRLLLSILQAVVAANPSGTPLLRGSLAANQSGWRYRSPEDIDLVCDDPTHLDLTCLRANWADGYTVEEIAPIQILDFGRPGIAVQVAQFILLDQSLPVIEFGIDVGPREYNYATCRVGDIPTPIISPEWLVGEKLQLISRRFAKRRRLEDVYVRDVIDVARWSACTLQPAVAQLSRNELSLDLDTLVHIGERLRRSMYPAFWDAQWRKAGLREADGTAGDLSFGTAWTATVSGLFGL